MSESIAVDKTALEKQISLQEVGGIMLKGVLLVGGSGGGGGGGIDVVGIGVGGDG